MIAGAAVCGSTSGIAATTGSGAGLRAIRFLLDDLDLRAAFRAGRRLAFRAGRRVAFRAGDRLRPADLLRPRTLLRAFFERVFRLAITSVLPMSEPHESVAL